MFVKLNGNAQVDEVDVENLQKFMEPIHAHYREKSRKRDELLAK